jgi:hypothetical protein
MRLAGAAEGDELRRQFGPGISDIEGLRDSLHLLAHFLVGDAENCRISHRRMCQPLSARRPSVSLMPGTDCMPSIANSLDQIVEPHPADRLQNHDLVIAARSRQTLSCLLNTMR